MIGDLAVTKPSPEAHMTEAVLRPLVALQVRLQDERGQTTTEYAILLGFLAIAIIIALYFLRDALRELFSEAASSVNEAPGDPVPPVEP